MKGKGGPAHLVGLKSLSSIDSERSRMMNIWRIIDLRSGVSDAIALRVSIPFQ
jgi:hypothetical protein